MQFALLTLCALCTRCPPFPSAQSMCGCPRWQCLLSYPFSNLAAHPLNTAKMPMPLLAPCKEQERREECGVVPCDTSISRLLVCLRAHLINSRAPRHTTPESAEQELKLQATGWIWSRSRWRRLKACGRGVCGVPCCIIFGRPRCKQYLLSFCCLSCLCHRLFASFPHCLVRFVSLFSLRRNLHVFLIMNYRCALWLTEWLTSWLTGRPTD